jgi:chromosome segregation ATPase
MKVAIATYESEVARRINSYEQNVSSLTRENDELKRKIRDAEPKISHFSLDLERRDEQYRVKNEEFLALESKYRSLAS